MTPRETAKAYDALASYWNGEDFNCSNGIEQHERALRFARKGGHALDLGCGSSGRFIDLLLSKDFVVEGVDISPEMLQLARKRHPQLAFHLADVCQWTPDRRYDFITAWDSIWHVPLSSQEALLRRAFSWLEKAGVMIFTCGGLDAEDERTNPYQGQPLYHATLGLGAIQSLALESDCVLRHVEFDQLPHPHVYVVAQKL